MFRQDLLGGRRSSEELRRRRGLRMFAISVSTACSVYTDRVCSEVERSMSALVGMLVIRPLSDESALPPPI